MNTYSRFNTRATPQSQPIPGSNQVANSAGGFAWEIDKWAKLDRFLILGTEGGTYYIKEQELTQKNAENVIACIKEDCIRAVDRIVEISDAGRAIKNDPALFALALCFAFGDDIGKRHASEILAKVARIGTHLFHFAEYVQKQRGWGRVLKRTVANWYEERDAESLGYQLVKYQQRDGWSHADLIKLSHPSNKPDMYNWVLGVRPGHEEIATPLNRTIQGYELIKKAENVQQAANLITEYRLPREAVPTQFLNDASIWECLLATDMGYEAMIRNLGNMGKVGLLKPFSQAANTIVSRLGNTEQLLRARLHPIKILVGLRQYSTGRGLKGSNEWTTVPQVIDALNAAFYESFKHVKPSGKNTMLALDVSGSMSSQMSGLPLTYCEGTAVMAMVTAKAEANYLVVGFADKLKDLKITANDTLESARKKAMDNNFGGTDCSLPVRAALEQSLPVEVFAVYTDNETWAGRQHPAQTLVEYRQKTGLNAKLAVIGMAANPFSIADPNDAGMLDFVGFDTNTPAAISEFAR